MNKIAIIGTGAYGLSIALSLTNKNYLVDMWVESDERAKFLDKNRNNSGIIPNIKIPKTITFSNDLKGVIKDTSIVIIAVAAKYVNSITQELSKYNLKGKHFAILSKGIEENTCDFLSDVFRRNIKSKNFAIISGPSFAIDLVHNQPVGLTIASHNKTTTNLLINLLSSKTIKLRKSKDLIGVQICGSVKNVIAIAAGILDGLGYKESTRSFLITESLHDIKSLIHGLGGKKRTILSYAGVGDLLLTCTSVKSRNYSYGIYLGKKDYANANKYLQETTVEGFYTLKSIHKLIKKKKIEMPIINLIYQIIFNKKDPEKLALFLIKKA